MRACFSMSGFPWQIITVHLRPGSMSSRDAVSSYQSELLFCKLLALSWQMCFTLQPKSLSQGQPIHSAAHHYSPPTVNQGGVCNFWTDVHFPCRTFCLFYFCWCPVPPGGPAGLQTTWIFALVLHEKRNASRQRIVYLVFKPSGSLLPNSLIAIVLLPCGFHV